MKRLLYILMFVMYLMMLISPVTGAVQLENTDTCWMEGVYTNGINNDAYDQAEMLKKLGLFLGTKSGFELERNMTRAEAAVMLVRFMGAEDKVLAGNWKHPFNDVPQWVDKYVGWLYQSGLTKGVSKTKYGTSQKATLEQYATFLSRAISGNDDWKTNGTATVDEVKLWDKENGIFTRGAAVGLSTRALTLTCKKNSNRTDTTARCLVDNGVFTVKQFLEAAWGVLPPNYSLDDKGYICNSIAGVTVGKTDVGGLEALTATDSKLEYFYVYATQEGNTILYRIDCKTMKSAIISTKVLSEKDAEGGYSYAATIDGKDYLFEYSNAAKIMNLVMCDGSGLTNKLSGIKLYDDSTTASLNRNYFITDDAMVITGYEKYYLVDKGGVNENAYAAGTQVLGFDGTSVVTQLVTEKNTTISCLHALDGTAIDTYTIDQDMQSKNDYRTVTAKKYGRFYGEAGLYVLDSENGRLKQITAHPTLDITSFRNDDRYIILTHELGKRVYSMFGNGGDKIIMIDDNGKDQNLLSNNPAHGISIQGLEGGNGGTVGFYSATDVGMQHANIYHYVLLPSFDTAAGNYGLPSTIAVLGYTAGRPETELEGYEQTYVEKEQARLDALGYGYKK